MQAIVWGCAFEIASESSTAIEYLQSRECVRGGYVSELVTFHPIGDELRVPIRALTFIAHSGNCMWLGEAPLAEISEQIARCKGVSGHNAEYMLKLAEYVRHNIPEDKDHELFHLEELVLQQLSKANLSLEDVMMTPTASTLVDPRIRMAPAESPQSSSNNDFAHRVPDKKLRCVNIWNRLKLVHLFEVFDHLFLFELLCDISVRAFLEIFTGLTQTWSTLGNVFILRILRI